MSDFKLIIAASLRDRLRWAKQHLYSILILTPLVTGMTYLTAAQAAGYAPEETRPSLALAASLAALLSAALIGLCMSRASAEIYHLRQPEAFLEAMPCGLTTHFHAALAKRLTRTAAVGLLVLVVRSLMGRGEASSFTSVSALALFVALIAASELFAALQWIHWGHTREPVQALAATLALLPAATLSGLLLLHAMRARMLPEHVVPWLLAGGAAWTLVMYLLSLRAHARWRASDIEYAKRLQTAGRWSVFRVGLLERRLGSSVVAAQLARDLQMTLRAFSSAVYVAFGMAVLWTAALLLLILSGLLPRGWADAGDAAAVSSVQGWFEATWLVPVIATKAACVLIVASLVSLLPVLVAHQLPFLWLERACGTTGAEMWQAKLWYARVISSPAPFVAWAVGLVAGGVPPLYAPGLLVECLWLWWMLSTLVGALSYEMPDQPGLSIILIAFICAGLGMLSAALWPIGIAGYGMAIDQVRERGAQRARFHLITEEA